MAETLATNAWLVWREGKEGRPEFHGLMKSEEAAAEEIELLQELLPDASLRPWHMECVSFVVGASLRRAAECLVAGR
jgi:hypothetical protein